MKGTYGLPNPPDRMDRTVNPDPVNLTEPERDVHTGSPGDTGNRSPVSPAGAERVPRDGNDEWGEEYSYQGNCLFKEDVVYLQYAEEPSAEEPFTEEDEAKRKERSAKGMIIIFHYRVEVVRRGDVSSGMVFEEGREHAAFYRTKEGEIPMTVFTHRLEISREEDRSVTCIEYSLLSGGQHLTRNRLHIQAELL